MPARASPHSSCLTWLQVLTPPIMGGFESEKARTYYASCFGRPIKILFPKINMFRVKWQGIWETLLEILIDDPDYQWLMIDASYCKVHPHIARTKGGNQAISRTKGRSIAMAVDAHGMPLRIVVTKGSRSISGGHERGLVLQARAVIISTAAWHCRGASIDLNKGRWPAFSPPWGWSGNSKNTAGCSWNIPIMTSMPRASRAGLRIDF